MDETSKHGHVEQRQASRIATVTESEEDATGAWKHGNGLELSYTLSFMT
jgi:hypothetical protein